MLSAQGVSCIGLRVVAVHHGCQKRVCASWVLKGYGVLGGAWAQAMDGCQELVCASWVAATKLQAAMRGRAERLKAEKKAKKGGKKSKK